MRDLQELLPHLLSSHATRRELDQTPGARTPRSSGEFLKCTPETYAVGRRPSGLRERELYTTNETARFFAKVAEHATASSISFEILRDELAHHGAPTALLRRIEVARRDELRHARAISRLARKFGARALLPMVDRPPSPRSLVEIAAENAAEGCVRETFGALVAHHQAANAVDVEVARIMKKVATDTTRHAELAWAVAEWLGEKLDESGRKRVEEAMIAARKTLAMGSVDLDDDLAKTAGLPDGSTRTSLLSALERDLFVPARTQTKVA